MTWEFCRAALIRAARTGAQSAIAAIGTTALIHQVDWISVLSMTAMGAVLSLLTSVATGLPEVPDSTLEKKDDLID